MKNQRGNISLAAAHTLTQNKMKLYTEFFNDKVV